MSANIFPLSYRSLWFENYDPWLKGANKSSLKKTTSFPPQHFYLLRLSKTRCLFTKNVACVQIGIQKLIQRVNVKLIGINLDISFKIKVIGESTQQLTDIAVVQGIGEGG